MTRGLHEKLLKLWRVLVYIIDRGRLRHALEMYLRQKESHGLVGTLRAEFEH